MHARCSYQVFQQNECCIVKPCIILTEVDVVSGVHVIKILHKNVKCHESSLFQLQLPSQLSPSNWESKSSKTQRSALWGKSSPTSPRFWGATSVKHAVQCKQSTCAFKGFLQGKQRPIGELKLFEAWGCQYVPVYGLAPIEYATKWLPNRLRPCSPPTGKASNWPGLGHAYRV